MTERSAPHPAFAQVHSLLMVALIGLRPLVWDEDPLLPTCTAYAVLLLIALTLVGWECLSARRAGWEYRPLGVVFAALVFYLGVGAWRSPLPVAGWGLWAATACQLGLAAYLLQVVPTRARLALAALASGLMGEALISVLQWPWVLPAMATAQRAGGLGAIPNQLQAALAERIANGGLYGTFTQANALGGYLLVAAAPLAVAAWQGTTRVRVVLGVILLLALAAFIGTSSKGAVIAAGAATLVCWWWRRWRGRFLVTAGAVLASVAVLYVHPLRQGLQASAEVRLGYWSGAIHLVREAPWLGFGLRSFGEEAPRVLPLWASYSSQVHNEVLGLAAETGVGGALLLVVVMAMMVLRPLPALPALGLDPSKEPTARWLPWAFALCVLYGSLLGLLDSNTGWWPGAQLLLGGLPVVQMGWWMVVAGVMAITCRLLYELPLPHPVACRWALVAVVLHSLIDFDWHAGGLVGTVVVVAILGSRGERPHATIPEPTSQMAPAPAHGLRWLGGTACTGFPGSVMMMLAIVLAIVALVTVQGAGIRIRTARAIGDATQVLLSPGFPAEQRAVVVQQIVLDADIEEPAPQVGQPLDLATLLRTALEHALLMASGDPEQQTRLLLQLPLGPARLPQSLAVQRIRPHSAVVASQCADDERAIAIGCSPGSAPGASAWHQACAWQNLAVALNPSDLRTHHDLMLLLEEAAQALPHEADALRAQAQAQRQLIERERPLVDGSNRD